MFPDKFERCYEEGKIIGFVQPTGKINIFGEKTYKKCPGENPSPGIIDSMCLKCRFLDRRKNRRKW